MTWPSVLSASVGRLRRDPWLLLPFLVAGAIRSLVDWLRLRGPIPVGELAPPTAGGLDVHVAFEGYPAGAGRTELALDSLVGLGGQYLARAIGLHVLVLLAVGVAGALVVTRATAVDASPAAVGRLLLFVAGADAVHRVLGSIDLLQGLGPLGLVPLALVLYVYVRLFAVPALLVEGRSVRSAIRRSGRHVDGVGWSVLGLVLALGLGAWVLAAVPQVGAALSTAVVAPLHAVAIVVLLERTAGDRRA